MGTRPSSTVEKAFHVLELFRDHDVVTTSLCVERLGIPRPTAHRLLVSLRQTGAVENDADGHYRLSLMLFELGSLAPERRRLGDRGVAALESLADKSGYRVHLGVRRDLDVLYLETIHGRLGHRVPTRVGHRGPMHATGLGKVLLAHAPADVIDRVLASELKRFTPSTLTDPEALRENLDEIRREGLGFDREERLPGLSCIAAPLRAENDSVSAAISIAATTGAMRTSASKFAALLHETVRTFEKGLLWEPVLKM